MTDDIATVPIPKEPLVDYLVELAYEHGSFVGNLSPPERGVEGEVEYSLDDMDWKVESNPENNEVLLHGVTDGEYQVKMRSATYNPPGAAHPAEYKTKTCPVAATIHVDIGGGYDLDLGDPEIEVMIA